jgi:signal transduction histidine kinase
MAPLDPLRRWLTAPVFEGDEERTLLARLLHPTLLSMLTGVSVYALFAPVQPDRLELAYAYCTVLGIMMVLLLVLNRRGHPRTAATVLVAAQWLLLVTAAATSGGVLAAAYSGLVVVVVCASVLLGRRAVFVTAGLSVVAGALLLLDHTPPPGAPEHIRRQAFLAQAVYLLAAGALLSAVMRAVRTSLARAQREARERQAALGELREAQAGRERLIRELEAKNTELESFTYTVSHDLRSPLVTIKGFLAHLVRDLESGNPARAEADVARIRGAADKMEGLLADLLELSRVGRIVKPPSEISFEEIVREALFLLQGRIAAREIPVEVAAGLPRVWGDRARLVQVVQNLVDNALKFSTPGPQAHILVGCRPGQDDVHPVLFVRDHGIGIAPEHLETVFGLFRRLDPLVEGSGIGLALVRRIVEVHGGRCWVESQGQGRGATFCLTLAPQPADRTAG